LRPDTTTGTARVQAHVVGKQAFLKGDGDVRALGIEARSLDRGGGAAGGRPRFLAEQLRTLLSIT
jgi:hypothetical protein